MPTYAYACSACGHRFDAVQSMADAALTVCPECTGALRRVYGSVGVTFKGSGFYRTDSRAGSSSTVGPKSAAAKSSGSKDSGSAGSGSGSSGSSSNSSGSGSSAPKATGASSS